MSSSIIGESSIEDDDDYSVVFDSAEKGVHIPLKRTGSISGNYSNPYHGGRKSAEAFSRPSTNPSYSSLFRSKRRPPSTTPPSSNESSRRSSQTQSQPADDEREDDSTDIFSKLRDDGDAASIADSAPTSQEIREAEEERHAEEARRMREERMARDREEREERERGRREKERVRKENAARRQQQQQQQVQVSASVPLAPLPPLAPSQGQGLSQSGGGGLLSSVRPSHWSSPPKRFARSLSSSIPGASGLKLPNSSKSSLMAALSKPKRRGGVRTSQLTQPLASQRHPPPPQTTPPTEDASFSFGKSFRPPPFCRPPTPQNSEVVTDNITLPTTPSRLRTGADKHYEKTRSSPRSPPQPPGHLECMVRKYEGETEEFLKASRLYSLDELDGSDPRRLEGGVLVDVHFGEGGSEGVKVGDGALYYAGGVGALMEGVWVAVGEGMSGPRFVPPARGGKVRFWGGRVVEGVVVGTERWEILR